MVEHRKGLNRTLFWLYAGQGKWPSIFRWAMLAFDLITIALFLVHPLVSWHDGTTESTGLWLYVDIFIVVVITLDFLARLYIERNRLRFFLRPTNVADLLVLATFVVPVFAQNLIFLRVGLASFKPASHAAAVSAVDAGRYRLRPRPWPSSRLPASPRRNSRSRTSP